MLKNKHILSVSYAQNTELFELFEFFIIITIKICNLILSDFVLLSILIKLNLIMASQAKKSKQDLVEFLYKYKIELRK